MANPISRTARAAAWLAACALLVSCGNREVILEGERINVRPEAPAPLSAEGPQGVSLPNAVSNSEWAQLNGASSHFAGHVAVQYPLAPVWSANIGDGTRRGGRITGGPIVSGGRVFAIDSAAQVSAFTSEGAPLWSRSLARDGETSRGVFGGGIAADGDTIVAGTGFSEIVAMNAETGAVLWRQETDAPVRAAPVISNDRVYAVARDDQAYGIDLSNGRIRWRMTSIDPEAGIAGGASPAARSGLVVIPFGSGEVAGALARNGRRAWTTYVAGGRRGTVLGRINDITGDPVIAGDTVFVANQSGQFAALDRATGERVWSTRDGSLGPALAVDNSVFFVTDQSILKRLRATDGAEIWSVDLPRYSNVERRRGAYVHSGPLMVGGRVLVASSDGIIRTFDPVSGEALGDVTVGAGIAAQPAIASGRVFVVTTDGMLRAFE